MNKNSDISDKTGFQVPEGYFDKLKARLSEIPSNYVQISLWQRIRPYVALAACFAVTFAVGTGILKLTASPDVSEADEFYNSLGYADIIPVTLADPALYESDSQMVVSEDDIVDYLIETGVSTERIYYTANINER